MGGRSIGALFFFFENGSAWLVVVDRGMCVVTRLPRFSFTVRVLNPSFSNVDAHGNTVLRRKIKFIFKMLIFQEFYLLYFVKVY